MIALPHICATYPSSGQLISGERAWTQIGCVAAELGETQSALDAFDIALQSHADDPDAHFHKAEVLSRRNRAAEAFPHWQADLTHDQRGPIWLGNGWKQKSAVSQPQSNGPDPNGTAALVRHDVGAQRQDARARGVMLASQRR